MLFVYPLQPDPDDAASPVVGWHCDEEGPRSYPAHRHKRAQLLHVTRGVVVLCVGTDVWTVPPHRAVWIPSNVEHSCTYPHGVAMRSLYFDSAALRLDMPSRCAVFQLDPLDRALVIAAAELPWDAALDGPGRRLVAVLLDRLSIVSDNALYLPAGRDKRVVRVMAVLRKDPSENRTIVGLARIANCSHRTLARLFLQETGMSLGTWRRQLRLQAALERLSMGQPVTQVAIELGYGTPSSFSTMFRRAFGISPARYFSKDEIRRAAQADRPPAPVPQRFANGSPGREKPA